MTLAEQIKAKASELGFAACGITQLELMSDDLARLQCWLDLGYNAGMDYMARNQDIRLDPRLLLDGARSAVVCLMDYGDCRRSDIISSYALRNDYHYILKDKLLQLMPDHQCRVVVDSAPVFERALAMKAGLGWIGRNSMLINKDHGSYTLIGVLLTTEILDYDNPYPENHCKGCGRCEESCPSRAIIGGAIDASRCISYHTIENRGEVTIDCRGRVFGCDICMEVCPHNRAKGVNSNFPLREDMLTLTRENLAVMGSSEFRRRFASTPLSRCGLRKLKENCNLGKK